MAVSAVSLPRVRSLRVRPALALVLVGLASATLYAWMRVPVARAALIPYRDMCARFAMRAEDWPCRLTEGRMVATYVGGSLLIGLALALPGVLLALSGRRAGALVPLGGVTCGNEYHRH